MKTGFCALFKPKEMEEAIRHLAKLGYEGLEFWDQYLSQIDARWLKKILEDNHIKVAQLCPYFDFTSGKEKWKQSIKITEKYLGLCRLLNCSLIRVFTGSVGSDEATKEQWKSGVKGLKTICKMGDQEGVRYALETHRGSLMDTTESALRLLQDVDATNLGVNLQVPLKGEDLLESARRLAGHVIHLHAHNWIGHVNWLYEAEIGFLDSGEQDFEGFVRILHEKGFDGYISIEHASHKGRHDPMETARHEIGYLKNLIERLSQL